MKLLFKKVIKRATIFRIREIIEGYHALAVFEGRYYVTLKDGRIAGCVSLVERGWYMTEIKHLFVKEEYRASGVGRFLLEEALKKVFTPLVCCTVRSDNKRSADLFLKNSFDIMGTFRNSMTDREIFLMVRNLQQKE